MIFSLSSFGATSARNRTDLNSKLFVEIMGEHYLDDFVHGVLN